MALIFPSYFRLVIGVGLWLLLTTAGSQAAEGENTIRSDTRLTAPIDLAVQAQSLQTFFAELPLPKTPRIRQTRLPDNESVTVFAKQVMLRDILDGTRVLFGLDEKTTTEAQPAEYTLFKSPQAIAYEARLYRRHQQQMFEPLMTLATYTRTPGATWVERRKQRQPAAKKTDDPLLGGNLEGGNLRSLAREGTHAALALLLTLNTDQRHQLQEEDALFLPWSAMSERQQVLAETIVRDPEAFENTDFLTGKRKPETLQKNQDWLHAYGLRLDIERDMTTGKVLRYDISTGNERTAVADFSRAKEDTALLPVRGCPYPKTDGAVSPDDTDLQQRPFPTGILKNRTTPRAWTEVLAELSQETEFILLSDDFPGAWDPVARDHLVWPDLEKKSMAEALDALCHYYGKLWWRDGNRLYFRSRCWFYERLYTPPAGIVQAIDRALGRSDDISNEVLDLLAHLTRKQLQGFANRVDYAQTRTGSGLSLGGYFQAKYTHSYLQFFQRLNTKQRQQARLESGLPWEAMSSVQQRDYEALGSGNVGRYIREIPPSPFQITVTKLPVQRAEGKTFFQIVLQAWQRRGLLKISHSKPRRYPL